MLLGTHDTTIYRWETFCGNFFRVEPYSAGYIDYVYCLVYNSFQSYFVYFSEETQTDWFSKINPMKCVPVMDDNGFVITER